MLTNRFKIINCHGTLKKYQLDSKIVSSKLFNFADDTTTDTKGRSIGAVKAGLKEDACNVLKLMASNGLIANQAKTEFMILNTKKEAELSEIRVGDTLVKRTSSTKLLGINLDDSQEWQTHLKTLKTGLNQRLFVIRRIAQHLPREKLLTVVHSLWISKLRYGLQLCSKVRLNELEPKTELMKSLQIAQNRMLRLINNTRIKDRVSSESILKKFNLLSVNQLAAQIKLTEVWKAINREGYPIQLEPYNNHLTQSGLRLRPKLDRVFNDTSRLRLAESSFNIDAARVWNAAPADITTAISIELAKKRIRIYAESLPV